MKQHYFLIGKTNKNENEIHWEAVPVLCFQNNIPLQPVLEVFFSSKNRKPRNEYIMNNNKNTIKDGTVVCVFC